MLLSVIIPCYNAEAYLDECLESVCGQTLRDMEIICVDDGSTDRTGEILEQWQEKDDRIRLFRQENRGLSAARNVGLRAAQGNYIYFLDSDDRIAGPEVLKTCCATMEENDLDILVGAGNMIYTPPELKEKYPTNKESYFRIKGSYPGIHTGAECIHLLRENKEWRAPLALKCYRRAFLQEKKLFCVEGQLHEDVFFTFRSELLAERIMITDKPFFDRRIREQSIMTSGETHENALGYLINFTESLRLLEANRQLWDWDAAVGDVVTGARKNVIRIYRGLNREERARFRETMTPEQTFYFRSCIWDEIRKTEQIAKLKTQVAALEKESEQEAAARKEREDADLEHIRKLEEENAGLCREQAVLQECVYTLQQQAEALTKEKTAMEQKISAAEKREKQAQAQLQAIRKSRSYRLGRLLSWPWRKLKQLLGL